MADNPLRAIAAADRAARRHRATSIARAMSSPAGRSGPARAEPTGTAAGALTLGRRSLAETAPPSPDQWLRRAAGH